jgi:integrase
MSAQRPQLFTLRDAAVSSKTKVKYQNAAAKFYHACYDELATISERDFDRVDGVLAQYFEQQYFDNESYSTATCTLYGLCLLFPKLYDRTQLCESKLRLRGWRQLQPSTSYPPLTWEMCCAISSVMVLSGDYHHAIATLLSFDCYLRISEFSNLTIDNIVHVGVDRRASRIQQQHVEVILARTKTGRNQSVIVRRPLIASLIIRFCELRRSTSNGTNEKLFNFSTASYRKSFRRACNMLNLAHIGYTPHSLRHGGATFDFQSGMSIPDIKSRGRWQDTKSAHRYIQTGVALLSMYHIPPFAFQMGSLVVDNFHDLIELIMSSL